MNLGICSVLILSILALPCFSQPIPGKPSSATLDLVAHEGEMDPDEKAFLQGVREMPWNQGFLHNLADLQMARKYFSRAELTLKALLELAPNDPWAHSNLGLTLGELGKHEEALAELETSLRLDSRQPVVHLNLGAALFNLGRKPQALDSFKEALKQGLPEAGHYLVLGDAFLQLEDLQNAHQAFGRAVALAPTSAEAVLQLGTTARKLKLLPEAVEVLQRASGIDATNPVIRNELARALIETGAFSDAAVQCRILADLGDPEKAEEIRRLLPPLVASQTVVPGSGKRRPLIPVVPTSGYEELKKKSEAAPADTETAFQLGLAAAGKNRFGEAAEIFRNLAASAPADPRFPLGLGFVNCEAARFRKQSGRPMPGFHKIRIPLPRSIHGKMGAASASSRVGFREIGIGTDIQGTQEELWRTAAENLRKAQALDPSMLEAGYHLGRMHFFKKEFSEARKELRTLLEKDPTFPDAHYLLGEIAREAPENDIGDSATREMVAMFGNEVRVNPDHLHARIELCLQQAALGEIDAAISTLLEIFRRDSARGESTLRLLESPFRGRLGEIWMRVGKLFAERSKDPPDVAEAEKWFKRAAKAGVPEGLKALAKARSGNEGGPIPITDQADGIDLFEMAVRSGDLPRVRSLIEQGVDVNSRNERQTPVFLFCRKRGVLEFLLEKGLDLSATDGDVYRFRRDGEAFRGLSPTGKDGATFLHRVLSDPGSETRDLVALALEKGLSPNVSDRYRVTPLLLAVKNKDEGAINLLQKHGADPNATDSHGIPVLHVAIRSREFGLARTLIAGGSDVNQAGFKGRTALHEAVLLVSLHLGPPEFVRFLLTKGAKPNTSDLEGTVPIHLCAGSGECARVLIEGGADPNVPNRQGMTILHLAVQARNKELESFLLEHGADPNVRDSHGRTPDSYAPTGY